MEKMRSHVEDELNDEEAGEEEVNVLQMQVFATALDVIGLQTSLIFEVTRFWSSGKWSTTISGAVLPPVEIQSDPQI